MKRYSIEDTVATSTEENLEEEDGTED